MSDIAKMGVAQVFDIAENVAKNTGEVAKQTVGATQDVGQAVVDLGGGLGVLTVEEGAELLLKLVQRLRAISMAAADAIPVG